MIFALGAMQHSYIVKEYKAVIQRAFMPKCFIYKDFPGTSIALVVCLFRDLREFCVLCESP